MSEMKESVFTVPAELTKSFRGLSLDMGASVFKLVYRTKEDRDEVSDATENARVGRLRLVMFPRRELHDALSYVNQRADITRTGNSEPPVICTTGVGCTQYGKQLCQELNVKLNQLNEFDCFTKSFHYLATRLSRDEFLEPFLDEAVAEPLEMVKKQLPMFFKMQDECGAGGLPSVDIQMVLHSIDLMATRVFPVAEAGLPLSDAEPDMFPCILAACGSSHMFLKISKDGSFAMVDSCSRGGRALFGIGSLLTGATTFDELIELAETGNARNLDQYTSDVNTSENAAEGDRSVYVLMADGLQAMPMLLFSFGKAAGMKLSDFKREDLARAWLQYSILDLIQCAIDVCHRNNVKRLFFSGAYCSSPLVRHIITAECFRRSLQHALFSQQTSMTVFDFVKPVAHLGALGCVVIDVENSLRQQ
jgi:pantothenate kinase